MKSFELRHRVGFEETNLVGNVYYVHFLRWQGRCREMFLAEHAPGVLAELGAGLALATVHCSCDYLAELSAFDEVAVRMRLEWVRQNRVRFVFEYWRLGVTEELVARGAQEVAAMRRLGDGTLTPTPLPQEMRDALRPYEAGGS
jgi:enediyne biosynthesis thioesterase